MDFGKLKDIAKTATEKTVAGVSKANETRKKASQETKISVGNQTIRKTIDGKYYLGFTQRTQICMISQVLNLLDQR